MGCDLLLINPNTAKPAVAPLGIEYVAEAVRQAGYRVEVLDLCFADGITEALAEHFAANGTRLVGV